MRNMRALVWGGSVATLLGASSLAHLPSLALAAPQASTAAAAAGQEPVKSTTQVTPNREVDEIAAESVRHPWALVELVEQNHVKPCPSEQLISAGLKRLYLETKTEAPADLLHRAAEVKTSAELDALIDAATASKTGPAQEKLKKAFVVGLLAAIPGGGHVMPAPDRKEQAVQEQISNNRYVGIGIALKVGEKNEPPVIMTAMLHGAARKAGMRAGDMIESVDGKETRGVALAQVVDWLRGAEGTPVTVTVRQPKATESRKYTMVRAKVPFEHVYGFRRTGEEDFDFHVDPQAPVAYVRIGSFVSSTLAELRQFERKLRGGNYRAVVLDLRGNPGGSLQHAALVAGALLDGNLMWTTKQRGDQSGHEFRAEHECLFRDWPMVVLIDGHCGSATSLVAAALKDNGRARLVGESTHMDGYIKSVMPLPGQTNSLLLATGRVERPKAERGWPLKPDLSVALSTEQSKAMHDWFQQQEYTDLEIDPKAKAPADPQLSKAVDVLREAIAKLDPAK
jgi:carboxyl-terminal processing protease